MLKLESGLVLTPKCPSLNSLTILAMASAPTRVLISPNVPLSRDKVCKHIYPGGDNSHTNHNTSAARLSPHIAFLDVLSSNIIILKVGAYSEALPDGMVSRTELKGRGEGKRQLSNGIPSSYYLIHPDVAGSHSFFLLPHD